MLGPGPVLLATAYVRTKEINGIGVQEFDRMSAKACSILNDRLLRGKPRSDQYTSWHLGYLGMETV
jgi:hypothetical protein